MKKKAPQIHWSESSQKDLESIIDYIACDSIQNAKKVYQSIKESCIKLEAFPNIGRIPPELKEINIDSYREILVSVWRVIYKPNDNEINILAVIDSRRDIDYALLNRLLTR